MCGIIGCVGNKEAVPVILEGLKRLEYRGYDSSGLAVIKDGELHLCRASGKIVNLEKKLKGNTLGGTTSVGHTRWSTHGRPSEENAHPHTDCTGKLVVVHNGIIENYLSLKERLIAGGHKFKSETDTEVVAHLIEEKIRQSAGQRYQEAAIPRQFAGQQPRMVSGGASSKPAKSVPSDFLEAMFFEAVRLASREIQGSYALGVLWAKCPDTLIGVRMRSPLTVGLSPDENFLASDVTAFLSHSRKALFMEDREIIILKPKTFRLFNLDGKKVKRDSVEIQWDRAQAEKGGYKHFMLKEIHEQTQAVEETLRGRLLPFHDGALKREFGMEEGLLKKIRRIQIVACGTAYHAGMVAKYVFEHYAGIPTHADIASEFRYREPPLDDETLLIAISQSGETADTLAAVRQAKKSGVKSLAICNSIGASLTRETDFTLHTRCGPEIGVASTKAFLGQLTAICAFALHLSLARGRMSDAQGKMYVEELLKLPRLVQNTLNLEKDIKEIAKKYSDREHFLFLGRHVNFPIALEGALKIKEISYVHAEGYAGGEMKHGPIAIIEKGMPVIAIATGSVIREKMLSNLEEARARGASIITLVSEGSRDSVKTLADAHLEVPAVAEFFSPILNVIPLQMFAYHIALIRNCNVDQPRNLAKSVTVE